MKISLKVTIIGAGLAGLTAAYRLLQQCLIANVYEAHNRPGGRILTTYWQDTYEELGGKSFLASDSRHIIALSLN